jgi:hypothetical protein
VAPIAASRWQDARARRGLTGDPRVIPLLPPGQIQPDVGTPVVAPQGIAFPAEQ